MAVGIQLNISLLDARLREHDNNTFLVRASDGKIREFAQCAFIRRVGKGF
jgi:hypothetical protein